jgi:hypothetical protein
MRDQHHPASLAGNTLPCARKRAYPTIKAALSSARYRAERVPVRLRVYACPLCGLFHLTHLTPEEFLRSQDAAGPRAETGWPPPSPPPSPPPPS